MLKFWKGAFLFSFLSVLTLKRNQTFYYDEAFGGEIDFVMPYEKILPAIEVKLSMPTASEIRPMQAYPQSEVWVYHWKDSSQLEHRVGPTKICSLVHRLIEY